ncbi:hypothetical protein [Clostridium sp. HV4-5-A1G]|nr:hypothetical protein [Clostridium sp. HV4-5-A1G]
MLIKEFHLSKLFTELVLPPITCQYIVLYFNMDSVWIQNKLSQS